MYGEMLWVLLAYYTSIQHRKATRNRKRVRKGNHGLLLRHKLQSHRFGETSFEYVCAQLHIPLLVTLDACQQITRLNQAAFKELLPSFFEYYKSHQIEDEQTGQTRIFTREFPAMHLLVFTLRQLADPRSWTTWQILIGVSSATLSRYFHFGLCALHFVISRIEACDIKFPPPTAEGLEELQRISSECLDYQMRKCPPAENRPYFYIKNLVFIWDGYNTNANQAKRADKGGIDPHTEHDPCFNGHKCTFNHLFCWSFDGLLRMAITDVEGSRDDSYLWLMVEDAVQRTHENYKAKFGHVFYHTSDAALPSSEFMLKKLAEAERTSSVKNQDQSEINRGTKISAEKLIRSQLLEEVIARPRISAEWGNACLRNCWRVLEQTINLEDKFMRRAIWKAILPLWNFRVRRMGISQINNSIL